MKKDVNSEMEGNVSIKLHRSCSEFQLLLFKNVLKPFSCNKSYKILQLQKKTSTRPGHPTVPIDTEGNNLCDR